MAYTDIFCTKILNQIVQRGSQELSDTHVIRKYLSHNALGQKKVLANQLLKQTGIKNQHCTTNRKLKDEQPPIQISKDQYLCKSVPTFVRKKHHLKVQFERDKCTSRSSARRKVDKKQNVNKLQSTKNTLAFSQEQGKWGKLVKLQVEDIQISRKSSETSKMRDYLIQKEKKQNEYMIKAMQQEERKKAIATAQKKKFQRELDKDNNGHTYHIDGKYFIYPMKSHKRAIQKEFPVSLNQSVNEQQVIEKYQTHKNNIKQEQFSINNPQNESKEKDEHEDMRSLYNNNNLRQTSSSKFIQLKPGICFTEPTERKAIKIINESKSSQLFTKPKSTFSKFLLKKECQSSQIKGVIGKKMFIKSKTQADNKPVQGLNKFFIIPKVKCRGYHDKIQNINEPLFKKLILNI